MVAEMFNLGHFYAVRTLTFRGFIYFMAFHKTFRSPFDSPKAVETTRNVRAKPSVQIQHDLFAPTSTSISTPRRGSGLTLIKATDQEDISPVDLTCNSPSSVEVAQSSNGSRFDEVSGKVARVIYETKDGYAVYLVKLDSTGKEATVGVTSDVKARKGDKIIAKGSWGTYRGKQTFKAVMIMHDIPKGARGIVTWLKTGVVSGVGKVTSERLAKVIGDEIVNIIGDADALFATRNETKITRKQAEAIASAWNSNANQPELVEFLGRFGIGEMTIAKIVRRYGAAARRIIENDPWKLSETIDGIGFGTADEIAMEAGHSKESNARIQAGIRYALDNCTRRDGHSGLPVSVLAEEARKLLGVALELVEETIGEIVSDGSVVRDDTTNLIYPINLHEAEGMLAERFLAMLREGPYIDEDIAREAVEKAVSELQVQRDEGQINAAVMAVSSPLSIITGGPGTGKSTTQKVIVKAFETLNLDVVLAAPTGRAAKRLSEVSGSQASTCHRLLSFSAIKGGFEHDSSNPFPVDRIITDEFSMVDVRLGQSFMDAVRRDAGVVIVGDVDQLPSVGSGQVLKDLIDSGVVPVTRLKTVHRQKGDSGIVVAAARINAGVHPLQDAEELNGFEVVTDIKDSYNTFKFRDAVVKLMAETMKERGFDPIQDVQVLSSMRRGDLGILALNEDLKKTLNPGSEHDTIEIRKRMFSIGDRIMHLRNDYSKKVYNGEVGTVTWIGKQNNAEGKEEPCITVDYSGYKAWYTPEDISDVELCWATTVHKSQGCEFPVVIFVCPDSHQRMLTRNLLYTAVTRAKKLCVVVGHDGALLHAINTTDVNKRFTGLSTRMSQ